MINIISFKKVKYIFSFIFIVYFISSNINTLHAKSINMNGINIRLNAEVIKENLNIGKNTDEDVKSDIVTDNSKKEPKDKSVKVELNIRNNNPYETADVTIVEKVNSGFKQLDSNKIDRKISFKLESNKEKTFKYNYRYDKHFILDQFNKLIYGENEVYDAEYNINNEEDEKITPYKEDLKNKKGVDASSSNIKDEESRKYIKTNSNILLIILISIIIGLAVLYGFILFLRTLRNKDIDFDDYNKFNSFVILLIISLFLNILYKTNIYANDYDPILYQKGQNFTNIITETVEFNERYYNFSYEITVKYENKHEITNYEIDTDGDLLVDALEYLYMTDINEKDTDGDGLSDYLEVMILNYNPNSKWTFNDGRNDGYRDYDGDGLRNNKEIEIGTDLTLYDTDGDNIDDYDEVNGIKSKDGKNTYQTDPINIDTDEDGLNDDVEIKLGLDPTNPITDGITPDNERKIEQELDLLRLPKELTSGTFPIVGVNSSISGLIEDNVKIKKYSRAGLENSGLIIGNPIKVDIEDKNDTLKISVDCNNYGGRVEKLMFVRYDNNELIPVKTKAKDGIVSADLTSGEYGLIDVEMYLRKLNIYLGDYD